MISLDNVSIRYGAIEVVKPLSLEIASGEFFTLLGPSGCGKTTILRAIAGFVPVAEGRILIADRDVTDLPAEKRDVGIVFQNYALFPHMTVRENVAFGLRVARRSKAQIAADVDKILDVTGIAAHGDKKPAALSGGQQQRVAIARSLVMGTRVLLFDEPLSNLDAKIRDDMRREIKALQRELGFTAVFVTHDQEEALSMSDRLLVFNAGQVEQIGTARQLYESPATPFVCQFVGSANLLGPVLSARLGVNGQGYLRPEHIRIVPNDAPDALDAQVEDVDYVGPLTRVYLRVAGEAIQLQAFSSAAIADLAPGQSVSLQIDRDRINLFGVAA
ncbi:ABC transporter ATP-binding protein [Frigidibacter sp. SD6-1]|uniref:ABC transporter ATP-binding protein n=1 Tax=Frigidibacter sp. SD6-1 TaxID=3032581 RepID=UPI0024E02C7D|nr:ABC transporter ATP-binding protein [Frigidibacter sp. SD6-1]